MFLRFLRVLALVGLPVLAGCEGSPNLRASALDFGHVKGITTTGGLRLVTERQRMHVDGSTLPVLCTEPSPDYAVGFGRTAKVDAKAVVPAAVGTGVSNIDGSLNLDFSRTETVSKIGEPTAGVLALRDGLYAACQSYVNGVIGHDAYSMILSQYGTLLVALVGNDKAQVGRPGNATLSALTVACISGHDRTRYPPGSTGSNRLLSEAFCRDVLRRVLARSG
ncbi:MAG: hypothetical protein J0M19_10450 [Sphingomonadales bacterium]|nr:hypothetical protein [Sphingomonadales bacterium]